MTEGEQRARRTCTQCGETKPLDEFYRRRRDTDARRANCKPCSIAATMRWQRDHPDHKRRTVEWWRERRRFAAADSVTTVTSEAALRDALRQPAPFYAEVAS